jgi:hypothetical protein
MVVVPLTIAFVSLSRWICSTLTYTPLSHLALPNGSLSVIVAGSPQTPANASASIELSDSHHDLTCCCIHPGHIPWASGGALLVLARFTVVKKDVLANKCMEEWRSFLRMAMIDADCDHRDFASVALIDFSSFRSFRHLLVKDGRAHCYVNALTGNAADPSCVCVHVCVCS